MKTIKPGTIAILAFVLAVTASLYVFLNIQPQWREQTLSFNTYQNDTGELVYKFKGKELKVGETVPYHQSPLNQNTLNTTSKRPAIEEQWVTKLSPDGQSTQYLLLKLKFHFGLWSLLPAFIAVGLCLLTKEPVTALMGGIVCGAFMLGRFDLLDDVLIPNLASTNAAGIILLYLWLLGGLMGIWTRTGAAQAFATFMTLHFVSGPRSAKLVAWGLGVLFFQGGTVSTVLVGTTVKPLADREGVSHEEMSYIVDSTGSPIASVLAFNAWPAYVQALIFVPGVAVLATESDRLSFFFQSIPFSFYGILAVMGTLLLSLDITQFSGKGIRQAMKRSRETGELDAPGAKPLSAKELQSTNVPPGYKPHVAEFVVPLLVLISIAVGTFILWGSPNINWAFATALMLSALIATFRGMTLSQLLEGINDGLKSVVMASVLFILAITVGAISKEIGGGIFLVEQLSGQIPYWLLPLFLQLLTMVIAFSTGTSWGTYAIAFPLAMPLAWAVGQSQGLENPVLFLSVCFATVLNGSVYGDQCSPISDTTILSSMTTGTDLMDHVKTQLVPATFAASLAAIMWMVTVLLFA
jgi:Na+/H+ antiporter NhaC